MSGTMVRLAGVSLSYGAVRAARDLDLEARRGELLALLGPSGCGKTTTLRLISGFEPPDSGEVEINGEKVAGGGVFVPPEKRRVGVVFQDYALFPHLSVERNVAFGLKGGGKQKSRVEEVLALARLAGLGERMPHELSGGQQQRVALARALAPEPSVVLLDEPFSNLDASLRTEVRREMREILAQADATAIFVTHDQDEALSIADEVAVMFDGKIVQSARPEDLYHDPATREVAAFVGEANFLSGTAENGEAGCSLGTAPARGAFSGEIEVMVRPEAVRLWKTSDANSLVESREFYGHDQLVRLRLDSGEQIVSRSMGARGFRPGERVRASIEGEVVVFPRTSDPREI
ncbi:MAG: ABC transporter ATP-binding protein [Rubrobacteraceae bacterium]